MGSPIFAERNRSPASKLQWPVMPARLREWNYKIRRTNDR
jgi:hypothetical protein